MDADKRKRIKDDYKSKVAVGAVYAIECGGTRRRIIKSTTNIDGIKNRFQFALKTKSCPDPALRDEWLKFGSDAFSLVVLEELRMKEDQSAGEFADDIKLLYELWLEKLANDDGSRTE